MSLLFMQQNQQFQRVLDYEKMVELTYLPVEETPDEELGGYLYNYEKEQLEVVPHAADAKVNVKRGVVITTTKNATPVTGTDVFGPGSFHENDYDLYFNNIKANVAARVEAYVKKAE